MSKNPKCSVCGLPLGYIPENETCDYCVSKEVQTKGRVKVSEPKRIQKPWLVDGQKIQEVVHGTILQAVQTAAQIMMLESEWPRKGNYVTTAKITREDLEFTLTLGTPDKPKQ